MARNRVGLGTFPLAGVFSVIMTSDAEKIVKIFLEEGGYYIDTAPMYGYGYVEKLLGKVLKKEKRESYFLTSKCGFVGIEEKKLIVSSKPKDIILECNNSLKRLKTDYLDAFIIHKPDPNTSFSESIETMKELKKKGKIKQIGVSNVSFEELEKYNEFGGVDFVQNRFSIINRGIHKAFEKYLSDHKIKLMPYQTVERGQLTSGVFEKYRLDESDLRSSKPEWEHERFIIISNWVRNKLFPISRKLHIPLSELAIGWCLYQEFTDHVYVGTTNLEHLMLNLKSGHNHLSKNVIDEIDFAFKQLVLEIKKDYGKEVHEFRGLSYKYF